MARIWKEERLPLIICQTMKSMMGRLGIPLYLYNKIEYYKGTSVSFIFKRSKFHGGHVQPDMTCPQNLARAFRIQALKESEVTDLRDLVAKTFALTLPRAWKWKLDLTI